MKLFIDTEFNGFGGALISMGIVDERGTEFYEVVQCPNIDHWVAENVIPVLGRSAIPLIEFQLKLHRFLMAYEDIHVIADWPEDILHFCRVLITAPGERINTPKLTMEIRRDLHSKDSATPHNAISDARAIKEVYFHKSQEEAQSNG